MVYKLALRVDELGQSPRASAVAAGSWVLPRLHPRGHRRGRMESGYAALAIDPDRNQTLQAMRDASPRVFKATNAEDAEPVRAQYGAGRRAPNGQRRKKWFCAVVAARNRTGLSTAH